MGLDDPDFIGSWMYYPKLDSPDYQEFIYSGSNEALFFMFVEERRRDNASRESIKGRIKDGYGDAIFEGELTPGTIKFTKRYSREAIERGSACDRVEYEGKLVDGVYKGKFTVINGVTLSGARGNWTQQFIMRKYQVSSKN